MNDVSMNEALKYAWQSSLFEALVEVNPNQQIQKIALAEAAIAERRNELNGTKDLDEKMALYDAVRVLAVFKASATQSSSRDS